MASRRGSDIKSALQRKGLSLVENDHHYLVLHVDGRATTIRTKVSHGRQDYDDGLLSMVQRQLRLPRKKDLLDLIDCPLSGADYVKLLKQNGKL